MKHHILFVCSPCSLKDFIAAADQNFGEDRSSLLAFCRKEKPEFLRTFNEADTEIAMELR